MSKEVEYMPKITKIEQQKKNKDRVSVYIDDEFAFGIHKDIIIDFNIAVGKEIEDTYIQDILKREEQKKANDYALNLLSFSARSEREICDRLRSKGYEDEIINNTLEMLRKYNFINDTEYAKMFTKDKMNFSKDGSYKIKQKLYMKGVDKDIIDSVVDELVDEDEEYERALSIAEKKYLSYGNIEAYKKFKKLNDFLLRKGFDYDIISRVITTIKNKDHSSNFEE